MLLHMETTPSDIKVLKQFIDVDTLLSHIRFNELSVPEVSVEEARMWVQP